MNSNMARALHEFLSKFQLRCWQPCQAKSNFRPSVKFNSLFEEDQLLADSLSAVIVWSKGQHC